MRTVFEVAEITNIRGLYLDDWDEAPLCWFEYEPHAQDFIQVLFEKFGIDRIFNVDEVYKSDIDCPRGPKWPK